MAEKGFEQEVLGQLAEIKTHQQYFSEGLTIIRQHGERITAVEASAKSAHHRIDGIWASAGILGTLAGAAVNAVISLWPGKGGHG